MFTKKELPFLIGRSKPVLSSTVPFAKAFGEQTSRPATEKMFTLSGSSGVIRGAGAVVVLILALMFLGRR